MKPQRHKMRYVWRGAGVGMLLLLLGAISTLPAQGMPRREVGKYFFADSLLNVAGGALLYSDCTHDGGLLAAPPFGPPSTLKLLPTYWVNDPDPTVAPYNLWPVPEALEGKPRLFLCYDVELISGAPPPFSEFCDWAPRDEYEPLEVDTNGDSVRDLLIDVNYRRGSRLCAP